MIVYYISINDPSFELSVFWLSDIESRINELRFSDSISLSFKMRLTLVTWQRYVEYISSIFRDGKHDDITSRNVM